MDVTFFLIPPQISATTIFFPPPIFGNGIATIATKFFFFPYFGNGIATIGFFFKHGQLVWETCVITEIQNFLSPTFSLSLSYFYWISATLLPKFILFSHFPK